MSQAVQPCVQAWWQILSALCLPANPARLAELLSLWQQPGRVYHQLDHLHSCLRLAQTQAWACAEPALVQLALFYHDAVYDPQRNDNEARSAALCVDHWRGQLPEASLGSVQTWILATATHDPAGLDDDGLRLLDIDLSILARDPDTYAHYARQIRQEYAFVPEPDYRRGRAQVLQRFLQRERLYHSDLAAPHWEGQARQNLQQELHGWLA